MLEYSYWVDMCSNLICWSLSNSWIILLSFSFLSLVLLYLSTMGYTTMGFLPSLYVMHNWRAIGRSFQGLERKFERLRGSLLVPCWKCRSWHVEEDHYGWLLVSKTLFLWHIYLQKMLEWWLKRSYVAAEANRH